MPEGLTIVPIDVGVPVTAGTPLFPGYGDTPGSLFEEKAPTRAGVFGLPANVAVIGGLGIAGIVLFMAFKGV